MLRRSVQPGALPRDPPATVSLHRTFHDDFDEHPLSTGRWVPHYAGGAAWPDARYWGGDGSDFKRKTSYNGEQQIYVDPRYAGRATTPLGLRLTIEKDFRCLDAGARDEDESQAYAHPGAATGQAC